jgi:Holliday junction resolvase RusA-like endonuclease
MRELSFLLDIEPVSINNSHGFGRGRRFKLPKTKKFGIELKKQLDQYKEEFDEIYQSFYPHKHCIHTGIYFYVPKNKFYTKGTKKEPSKINRNSKDLDNCLKVLNDGVFKYIGIDDCNIVKIEAEKIAYKGDKWRVVYQLFIRDRLDSFDYHLDLLDKWGIV